MDTEILDNIQLYGFKWYRRVTMLGVAASTAVIVGGVWMMADGLAEDDLMAFLWGGMLAFLGTWLAGECTFILDRLYRGWKIYGFLHGEYAGHKNDAGWLQDTLGKVQEKIERGGMGVELYGKYHTLLCKRLRILKKRPCQLSVIPYQKILVRLIRKEIFLSLWLVYTLAGIVLAADRNMVPFISACGIALAIVTVQAYMTAGKIKDYLYKISYLEICSEIDNHTRNIGWLGEKKNYLAEQAERTNKERQKDLCRKGMEYIDFVIKERKERLQQQGGDR